MTDKPKLTDVQRAEVLRLPASEQLKRIREFLCQSLQSPPNP